MPHITQRRSISLNFQHKSISDVVPRTFNLDCLFVNPPSPDGEVFIRDIHRVGRRSREKMIWPQVEMKAGMAPVAADASNATELGTALYTKYVYPFELAAVLLLVAIIAAIVLTMRHRQGLKVQDINAQVATRREDRVRVLKMPAEKRRPESNP